MSGEVSLLRFEMSGNWGLLKAIAKGGLVSAVTQGVRHGVTATSTPWVPTATSSRRLVSGRQSRAPARSGLLQVQRRPALPILQPANRSRSTSSQWVANIQAIPRWLYLAAPVQPVFCGHRGLPLDDRNRGAWPAKKTGRLHGRSLGDFK